MFEVNEVTRMVCNSKSADDGVNGWTLNMFSLRLCSTESVRIGPDVIGDV